MKWDHKRVIYALARTRMNGDVSANTVKTVLLFPPTPSSSRERKSRDSRIFKINCRTENRQFFAPEDLPVIVFQYDQDRTRMIVYRALGQRCVMLDGTNGSSDLEGVIADTTLTELRDAEGVWSSDFEALKAEMFVRLRSRFPGSWKLIDLRRLNEANVKAARRAGYTDSRIRIPDHVKFYEVGGDVESSERINQIIYSIAEDEPVKQALRVAVIGGDKRVEDTRIKWPDDMDVQTFTGDITNATRIVESARAGKIDRVVILTRWNSHSAWQILRGGPAQVHTWPYGVPRLAKEIHQVLGVPRDALPDEPPLPPITDRDSKPWREVVLAIVSDYGSALSTNEVRDLVGMPPDWQDTLAEALEWQVERGNLVRSGDRYTVAPPKIHPTPPLPGPAPRLPAPINGSNGHHYPALPAHEDDVKTTPTKTITTPPPAPALPAPVDDEDAPGLAELGAIWAVQRTRLAKFKKRRQALAAELEKLDMQILEAEHEVEKAEAEVNRYAEL